MTHDNHQDAVEQLLKSFADIPIPDGPSADLAARTLNRLNSLPEPHRLQTFRRTFMNQVRTHRSAIAACSLLAAGMAWIGLMNHSGRMAFADVKQEIQKIRTVRYINTRLVENAADDPDELREMERKGVKPHPGRVFKVAGNAHQPRIIKISGRHLQRTETLDAMGVIDTITIDDFQTGKHVMFFPKDKKMTELDGQITYDANSKKTSEEKMKAVPEADLFAKISEVPADATRTLPARMVAGKQVIGFFSTQTTQTKEGSVTWERTYWIDPATKLPARIEVSCYGTDPRMGRSDWLLSGFVFDEEIPADEFSTETPEGYTRETQKVYGIKIE
jgi:outer membrane lipoprotein-sorting protein